MKLFLPLLLLLSFTASAQTVNISGRVYFDANGNHIFDSGDSPIPDVTVDGYNNGNNTATTDADGTYSILLPLGSYFFMLDDFTPPEEYKLLEQPFKIYNSAGVDVVDFAFQKSDSIEYIRSIIQPDDYTAIPSTGSTQHYQLLYSYDGSLLQMPVTLTLKYNPAVTLVNATPPPDSGSNGNYQWNIASLARSSSYFEGPADTIFFQLKYPAVGDTIGSFIIASNFIPGVPAIPANVDFGLGSCLVSVNSAPVPTAAPTSGVKWLRHFNNITNGFDHGVSIDTIQNGDGYFVAGFKNHYTNPAVYNDPTPFIAKVDKDGLSIWEKYLDSLPGINSFDDISAIKHTLDGGCIVSGTQLYYDDTFTVSNNAVIVLKFDSLGKLVWSKKIAGSKYENAGTDMAVLPDGSFFVTGSTKSHDGDFVNTNADVINSNVFLTKLSATGSIIFTKVYGGSEDDFGYKITALQNGSFLINAGTESSNGDVKGAHPQLKYQLYETDSTYTIEAWIFNIDASGNILWSKCYGGSTGSEISGVAENNGGMLLTGSTNSKDGDLPYYPEREVSLWVLQISATGNIIWNKQYKLYKGYQDSDYIGSPLGVNYNSSVQGPHKTKDGNFVIGTTAGDKHGAIRGMRGLSDIVLLKLNTTGDIIWQKDIGGIGFDDCENIQVDKDDNILFTGFSTSDDGDLYQNSLLNSLFIVGKVGITNTIKGQVFVDNNGNHIKDAAEHYFSEGRINSSKYGDTIQTRIFNGIYLNNVDTGNYVSAYKPLNNYYTVTPVTHNSSFSTFDLKDSFDFALTPKPNIKDLEVQLLPLNTPRPGFAATYRIITKNVGTATINNVIIGFKKDSREIYQSASRPNNGIAADSIWWGPFTLNAFDIDTLNINVTLAVPPTLNNGDTLTETVTANPVINDSSATNNIYTLREITHGSFDPNEKTEIHAGTLSTTQYANADYLQYQVSFQNTGSDTAFFITVKDTLQAGLDLKSLEIVASSHPYAFRLDGNVATWDFKNIKLPDNTTNEAASHGFILFKVKAAKGLAVGDEFSNKAAIYFDYNLPVITNQEKTVIGSKAANCPGTDVTFVAGLTGSNYQWQVNNGTGYINLTNTGIYSGVNTASLKLLAPPTNMYGYKFRCVVNGTTNSPENKLRFGVQWKGTTSSAWENPLNWTCGVLPDAQTEVIIPVTTTYPFLASNAACYSLRLSAGSTVTVKTGFKLLITGTTN